MESEGTFYGALFGCRVISPDGEDITYDDVDGGPPHRAAVPSGLSALKGFLLSTTSLSDIGDNHE